MEGFCACVKTFPQARLRLPRPREAGWVSDVPEISKPSPITHPALRDRGQGVERIERRSTSGPPAFTQAPPALPEQLVVVAIVYSLASQRRVG